MKPRQRKCKHCREWYMPFNSLQKSCTKPACAIAAGREQQAKKRKRENQRDRERIKSLTEVFGECQRVANEYVKHRDKGLPCISCGNPQTSDAGHYYHAGSKYRVSLLRLDPRNLNMQCGSCNRFKGGGNAAEYMEGYISRYGQAAFDELQELKLMADRGELPQPSKDDVRRIKAHYRDKIRRMSRG